MGWRGQKNLYPLDRDSIALNLKSSKELNQNIIALKLKKYKDLILFIETDE